MSLTKSTRLLQSSVSGAGPPLSLSRSYATHGNSSRRQVTIANDDGRVQWSALSTKEKAARTTQQTMNLGIVAIGAGLTLGVGYLLYDTVFSSDSKVSHFNAAFEDIKDNSEIRSLLGPANKLHAYGEASWNKWTRNRPIASTTVKDAAGRERQSLRFYVEGPDGKATVQIQMVRRNPREAFEYELFSVQIPGHQPIYLRGTDPAKPKSGSVRMLGVKWK